MELQLASKVMSDADSLHSHLNPIDKNYMSLHATLEALERNSSEFDIVQTYLTNTHASTHSNYTLDLLDVFKLSREGEDKRFESWANNSNRQLLWHGSRLTNWIGIVSQGLRIAPPEAPVTGYMFGKGVYFANMVSKSANYCFTSRDSPIGILLLAEVALGTPYELTGAMYMDKAPDGCHSTKGCGGTAPDVNNYAKLPDGCAVPSGKPVKRSTGGGLLYDEYIVYDVSQVRMRYLLKVQFNYNY